jgi:hypothetical protein
MRAARIVFAVVWVAILLMAVPAHSQEKAITGQVIDIVSYMTTGATAATPAGKEILMASAKGGNPLGILESSTGKIYLVSVKQGDVNANDTLLQYVGLKVTAKGRVFSRGSCAVIVVSVIGKSIK